MQLGKLHVLCELLDDPICATKAIISEVLNCFYVLMGPLSEM